MGQTSLTPSFFFSSRPDNGQDDASTNHMKSYALCYTLDTHDKHRISCYLFHSNYHHLYKWLEIIHPVRFP